MSAPGAPASAVTVSEVGEEAAAVVTELVHAGFRGRPALDPPATALDETEASIGAALRRGGGLLASVDGRPVGSLVLDPDGPWLGLRRVAVDPEARRSGVAAALVAAAEEVAERRGLTRMRLVARAELPTTVAMWHRFGYRETGRDGPVLTLAKEVAVRCVADDADATRELGRRLATVLRAGDLLILSGDLGAGKTTLTQGIGEGLRVRGPVTSPTFVLARVHPPLGDGPPLVHVDAYRLGLGADASALELDDLDLDVSTDAAVTVVEWGEGLAERLAEDRLQVTLRRPLGGEGPAGDPSGDPSGGPAGDGAERRVVTLAPVGRRWVGSAVRDAVT